MSNATAIALSEPFSTPEMYVSGLGRVEDMGDGNFRFVFFARKHGEPEAVISLIAPMQAIPPALCLAAKAVGISFAGAFHWSKPN